MKNTYFLFLTLLLLSVFTGCTPSQGMINGGFPGSTTASIDSTNIVLKHSPIATADLIWEKDQQTLKITVSATGLAPTTGKIISSHPVHIHLGTCANSAQGHMLYTLPPLQANAQGVGSTQVIFTGVHNGIPARGWYLNIHNGPTLNRALQARPIACGEIENNHPSIQVNQNVHLMLHATTAPDEAVYGTASIQKENNTFVVVLSLHGLVPDSQHMAHIHTGSCEAQGPMFYTLKMVTANAQGQSITKTIISTIPSVPASGFYINVHEASQAHQIFNDGQSIGMDTQQGFNPIACGNIGSGNMKSEG